MPDEHFSLPDASLRLEPPIAVPAPAPLDMPRRRIRLLPFELPRIVPRPVLAGRSPENSRAG